MKQYQAICRSKSRSKAEGIMNQIKVAILGGGVTGVTLAKELAKSSNFDIDLIEKASSLGGFHRNFEVGELKYDIGAFTFHKEHHLFKAFPGIIDLYQPIGNNFGSVVGKNNLDSYPCSLKGYIKYNGLQSLIKTCLEMPFSKLLYWQKNNIPAFVKYYIGKSAYHKTGLKNYIERLYQVSDKKIDLQFANKRLSCIKETGSLRAILAKRFKNERGFLEPAVMKSVYVRPKAGFNKIYSTFHETLVSSGVSVKLNSQITSIRKITTGAKPQFEIEIQGEKKIYDEVVSTIPIPVVSQLIGQPLKRDFDSIDLLTLFYRFNGDMKHQYNVLHNFTLDGAWKKITTFSQYYGKHEGDDYFSVEITLDPDAKANVVQLQKQFEAHVQSLGLYAGEFKLQGSLITKNAYPVYLRENVDEVLRVKDYLRTWGLRLAGRQGEFDYLNSSDASANAVKIAKLIKQDYCATDNYLDGRQLQPSMVG